MNNKQLTISNEPRTINDELPQSTTNNELCSINNDKLCKTNPIPKNPKIVVNLVKTRNYNNKQRTMNYSKQTQSNPILSASGGLVRRSLGEGGSEDGSPSDEDGLIFAGPRKFLTLDSVPAMS